MAWSQEQQIRLQREIDIISTYFPSFSFTNVNGELCLEGWMKTNSGNNYKIRLYVPVNVPNSVPDVVIISPNPLQDFRGRSLSSYSATGDMHLLNPRDGYPKICHYKSDKWNPNVTFYKVLVKARIWLEALDGHKQTGRNLDYYLKHQS